MLASGGSGRKGRGNGSEKREGEEAKRRRTLSLTMSQSCCSVGCTSVASAIRLRRRGWHSRRTHKLVHREDLSTADEPNALAERRSERLKADRAVPVSALDECRALLQEGRGHLHIPL